MPIRGVIFDFGGVIINMRFDCSTRLEDEYGLERGAIARSLYGSRHWRQVQVGEGSIEEWRAAAHQELEAAVGRSLPPLHERWRRSWWPILENVELARSLRPTYRTAILSNADSTLEDRLRDGMRIYDLFDTVVCSATVRVAKPDPRVYRLTADRLGVPVHECVLVDDSVTNVDAARELGMAAVHFRVDRGDRLPAQLAHLGVRVS